MFDKPLLEFRLDATPFGPRAPELLRAAAECFAVPLLSPGPCAAAVLTEDGAIHASLTEVIGREPCRHAVSMAVNRMLRTPERRILMAAVVRKAEDASLRLILPCGACRMLLHAYGGREIRIVRVCDFQPTLTIVALNELLPYADGGPGRSLPPDLLEKPQD